MKNDLLKITDCPQTERTEKIAIVTHDLRESGGVAAVVSQILSTTTFEKKRKFCIYSLSTKRLDPVNLQALRPKTWMKSTREVVYRWNGHDVNHMGAIFSEFEVLRYLSFIRMKNRLRNYDKIIFVIGIASWAFMFKGLKYDLYIASRVLEERKPPKSKTISLKNIYNKFNNSIVQKMELHAIRNANVVAVMNQKMSRWIEEKTYVKTTIIYPGLCLPSGSLNEWPLTIGQNFKIITVARYNDPRKRADLILQVYSELRSFWPDIELVLVSMFPIDCELLRKYEEIATQVHINASREELRYLYDTSDIFLLMSDEEGFGMVLIEAMQSKSIVISTMSGGPQEIITDGVDGILIPLGDVMTAVNMINNIIEKPHKYASIAHAASETVKQKFSLDSFNKNLTWTFKW
jgi:D-inositol-3-phosphate glycosyltransferase